jgi:branched chain amino acid efflux pump
MTTASAPASTPRAEFLAGMRDTIPMDLGALPFGIIFGALAVTSGLTPVAAVAMSAFVFAGSSQYIAVGLVAQQVSVIFIVFTTLIVNLRHALYSATLAPYFKSVRQRYLIPMAFMLTDETFVIVVKRFEERGSQPYGQWYYLGSAVLMYSNWLLWTVVGVIAGQTIPDPGAWGLDFAAVVTFTGMVVSLLRSRSTALAVVVSGLVAVIGAPLPNKLGLMLAALAGVAAGVIGTAIFNESEAVSAPSTDEDKLLFGRSEEKTP